DEEGKLVAELERLLTVYGSNRSFSGYCGNLIEIVRLRRMLSEPAFLESWTSDPSLRMHTLPMPLRLKLAVHALQDIPVRFEDAAAAVLWLRPGAGGLRHSGAVARARPE